MKEDKSDNYKGIGTMFYTALANVKMLPVIVFLVCFFPLSLVAQINDSVLVELNVLFPSGSVTVDMNYMDNGKRWNTFEEYFRTHFSGRKKANLRLDIYSGASPEGIPSRNKWLAENRGRAVRNLIRQRLGLDIGNITIHNEGARWDALFDLIYASNESWKDEVLRIIAEPASDNENQRDPRETKLRNLQRGQVWKEIEPYLAQLRTGANAILSYEGKTDIIVHRDTIVMMVEKSPVLARDTFIVNPKQNPYLDSIRALQMEYPAWAVKTNLMFWAVGAPNIQVEIPLWKTNQWSLEAEYFFPWYVWSNNTRAMQIQNLGVEMRYWLGDRQLHPLLQGFHVGAALAFGFYDWESKSSSGYQGEYLNIYANVGYQHRWGQHWAVDVSIGFGLIASKYRHYLGSSVYPENHLEENDDHLVWRENGNFLWPGICHASVSLCYMFNAWPFHVKPERRYDK